MPDAQLQQAETIANDDGLSTVFAVFADEEEAKRVARMAVEDRLCACANVLSAATSYFRWQGKITEAVEWPVLFKTRATLNARLIARIKAMHSYEVPAVVAWPVSETLQSYAAFVDLETLQTQEKSPR